ncbi:MAG: VIT domain-containing protein, partial [bacterium]|nr:VIT domain-containing protein [bacterium]
MPRNAEKYFHMMGLLMILIVVAAIFSPSVQGEPGNDGTTDIDRVAGIPFRASIRSINVTVDINHSFTSTIIEQVFFNPFRRPLSDTFMFKVPQGAFITNFSVSVEGNIHYAELMEKGKAEESFEDAVAKGHFAGILLSRETTKFPYSLNFGPSQAITCRLVYEEFTSLFLGRYKYDLFLHGINGHRIVPSLNIDIRVKAPASLTALNATGNFQDPRIIWENPEKCIIRFSENNVDKISNLFFRFETESLPLGGRLMSATRENKTYFIHLFSPTQDSLGALPINKNIIFVLDKSGSMSETKIKQLKSAFSDIIQSLDRSDSFNVIMFDTYIEQFSEIPVPASGENRNLAIEYVKKVSASGCTNLYDSTALALGQLSEAVPDGNANMPVVIMLTDGLANRGDFISKTDIRDNIKNLNDFDASLYCLGFGDDVDFDLLNNVARDNNGMARKIYTDTDAVEQLVEFYRMVSTPLMRNLSFSYSGDHFVVYPEKVDCIFDGSEVIIAGMADGIIESVDSTVTGQYSDGEIRISSTFDIDPRNESDLVPRFWAYKKTLHLLDRISREGEQDELVSEIVALSLEFGFLTRYTGFFVDVGSFTEGNGAWNGESEDWMEDPWDPENNGGSNGWDPGDMGTDPNNPDTDGDGLSDEHNCGGPLDYGDDYENWGNYDHDHNGIPDNQEPDNPNADSDGDGLENWQEDENGTDPCYWDTDGDGFLDRDEVFQGSDPCDPESIPETADPDGDGLS